MPLPQVWLPSARRQRQAELRWGGMELQVGEDLACTKQRAVVREALAPDDTLEQQQLKLVERLCCPQRAVKDIAPTGRWDQHMQGSRLTGRACPELLNGMERNMPNSDKTKTHQPNCPNMCIMNRRR
eukprot:GHVT01005331.1.p2 GENE.GHVT01005331.1~~GHVT01005331.1.p2  ORF type:complete len:127 (-),score=13.20 GHVT01005331.1:27-407(-)